MAAGKKTAEGRGFGFLFEMGCGKTLTAIATMGAAYEMGAIKTVLIIAPTSVCSVWPKEFDEYADFKYNVAVLLGDKQKRLAALRSLAAFPFEALRVAVINYESTWREGIFEALLDWHPDMIICDESQRIKEPKAKQSRAMHELGDAAKYKLILSGTPIQNNAIDLYSQYRFLDPTVFGTNFFAFRNRYAIMGGFDRRQIVGYKDLDKLIQKEHSVAYRVTKEEALDLPEQTFLTQYITLEGKDKQLYNQIKRDSFAELEDGGQITAPTVLTKLLRLQQFTGGFIQADEGIKPEFVFKGKINALEDILDDYVISAGKKLVIFCRFRPEIDLISDSLKKKKIRFASIYGDIKIEDRGPIVEDFQKNPETKVFLAQIDTAGLGITLTAADTCVYYSENFNYAAYSQSLARIHRIGQKNRCTYIHLVVEHSIDETILKALARKEDLAKTVVDDWRQYF
ncbi:helicase C-terminal domain protein [Marvinbryantia formatexigens DSM 14469]|uniref:Helicase C-terminal domain protein n=1 Tax=Marvinbryantia formatexigens DSM 14469 TaxID=478749 RepID=C6LFV2_9FIRM|nr:DEAD/DEAH box helicase [Marvinbryantia formatexigens]EET60316.1 helicase C-terminal domain protein [Marvinbryantia formatexigens DSM 14469]UWO25344.1 DEAD/DEAH box helicase [Marvinbryantia formatexigens DSM 14469]SDH00111.1 Helicase conserved C-terminal domain-containing protein [Marvinbryantia formatexigens]